MCCMIIKGPSVFGNRSCFWICSYTVVCITSMFMAAPCCHWDDEAHSPCLTCDHTAALVSNCWEPPGLYRECLGVHILWASHLGLMHGRHVLFPLGSLQLLRSFSMKETTLSQPCSDPGPAAFPCDSLSSCAPST